MITITTSPWLKEILKWHSVRVLRCRPAVWCSLHPGTTSLCTCLPDNGFRAANVSRIPRLPSQHTNSHYRTSATQLGHPGRGLVTTLSQFRNHFPRDTILPFWGPNTAHLKTTLSSVKTRQPSAQSKPNQSQSPNHPIPLTNGTTIYH
jgi:hypothetical protein